MRVRLCEGQDWRHVRRVVSGRISRIWATWAVAEVATGVAPKGEGDWVPGYQVWTPEVG